MHGKPRPRSISYASFTLGLLLGPALLQAAGGAPAPQEKAPAAADGSRAYAILEKNCFKCHGEGTRLSKLDLRTRELALKGGEHGPAITPGKGAASRLFRMVSGHVKPQMPPTGGLPDADVQTLLQWISAGAPYPKEASAGGDGKWWAFRPVKQPAVPNVQDAWAKNPIDRFLLKKMKAAGVRPNPPADRATLIRRATFDLHGLPPTPEEIDAFVKDTRPDAYERLVDRLLASPRYGERWARYWLDLARFAESEGFKADETRPNAWRYRDYVIQAFNEDRPYDRFVKEQIAGDELYPNDPQAQIATGFCRHWADESNAKNIPLRRQEILNDMTDVTGSVVLGLTVGCARCHDHKYDPITHKDYYKLQAFFAASFAKDDIPLVPPDKVQDYRQREARWEAQTQQLRGRLEALEMPFRAKLSKGKRAAFTDDVIEALDTPAAKRTALQWQLYNKVLPQVAVSDEEVGKSMSAATRSQWEQMRGELAKFDPLKPPTYPVAIGIHDVGMKAAPVHVLRVGVYDAPMDEVQPGFITAVDDRQPRIQPIPELNSSGRRTALAEWLTSRENPLTARVMVNRIWQGHFGRGIVPTSSDFGKAGEAPTHPELLDWLAAYFVGAVGPSASDVGGATPNARRPTPNAHPWSLKALHRLIMTSAAYQQSSAFTPASAAKDPDDSLLWRYRRWRLEGEAIRDACLAMSGDLNLKMAGPSVFPELPEGVSTRGGWTVSKDAAERNRRSVYVFVRRNMRYPLFAAFDFPDTHEPCARRSVTNTAPQALMLFNSSLALKQAQSMAGRLLKEASSPEARVERAYRLAFGRGPETAERDGALQFMRRQEGLIQKRLSKGEPVALPTGAPEGLDRASGAALVDFCHAMMNANEFLYVD